MQKRTRLPGHSGSVIERVVSLHHGLFAAWEMRCGEVCDMELRPPTRRQAAIYNYAEKGRAAFLEEHRGRVVQMHLERYIREAFGDRPWSMLDVGGGSGILSDYLHEQFPQSRATVLDISPELLDANVRAPWKTVLRGSATDLAARAGGKRFDLVCIHNVLHHVVDGGYRSSGMRVRSVVRQVYDILAPRGHISLFEMSYRGWPVESLSGRIVFQWTSNRALGLLCRRLGANAGGVGVRFLPEAAWRDMLVRSGFDVLDTVRAEPFRFPLYVRVPLAMRIVEPVHFWCRKPD